jgi:hypothetical protein
MFKRYSYLWVTGFLFAVSISAQWITHDGTTSEFINAVAENWQSEFLQLMWQVGGLMVLYAWGSSQSPEEVRKQEQKLNDILREVKELKGELKSQRSMENEPDQFSGLREPPRKS